MESQVRSKGQRILVADDNQLTVELITDSLEPHGYIISAANTGDQALRDTLAFCPDLILLDLQLPGIDGLGVAGRLRSHPEIKQVPIVAITAYSLEKETEAALSVVFDGFLLKPFSLVDLLQTVQQHLSGSGRPEDVTTGPVSTRS